MNKLFRRLGRFVRWNTSTASPRRIFKDILAASGVTALLPREKKVSGVRVSSGTGSTLRADLLLSNGNIITLDSASSTSEAVAVRGSKIVAVGKTADLEARVAPDTRRINLQGQTLLPGFFDTHPHMDREGLKTLGGASLIGANSVSAIVERVAEAATRAKPGEWLVFMPMGGPPFDYVNNPSMLQGRTFFPTVMIWMKPRPTTRFSFAASGVGGPALPFRQLRTVKPCAAVILPLLQSIPII